MGLSLNKLKKIVDKVSSPLTKATTKFLKTNVVKPLDKIIGGIGDKGVRSAFTKGFGVVPEDKDPMGLGDETKPLTMPTLDMDVVEEARKRALLLRQQSSGRRSTILADTRY